MKKPVTVDGLLYFDDARVARVVNAMSGGVPQDGVPYVAIGIMRADKIVAGVVFWNSRPLDIFIAVGIKDPRFVTPRLLASAFAYPFIECGLPRVSAEIDASNTRSRRLAEGLGFQLEGMKRSAASDGGDVCCYGLLRDEFKYRGFMPKPRAAA